MNSYLLDVNVLISLIDSIHPLHEITRRWFVDEGRKNWCSCPLTQNGALRVSLHPSNLGRRMSAVQIAEVIDNITNIGSHHFLPDDVSILDQTIFDLEHLRNSNQLTDTYLVALAAKHDAVLATLDTRIVTTAVRVPGARVHVIGQRPTAS